MKKKELDPLAVEKGQRFHEVLKVLGISKDQLYELILYTSEENNIKKKYNGSRPITTGDIHKLLEIIENDKENHYIEKIESYFKTPYREMLDGLLTHPHKEHKKSYLEEIKLNLKDVNPLLIYKLISYYYIFDISIYSYFERYFYLSKENRIILNNLLDDVKLSLSEFLTISKEAKALISEFIFNQDIENKFNKMEKKDKSLVLNKLVNKLDRLDRSEMCLERFCYLTKYLCVMDENDWNTVVKCLICGNHNKEVYKCLFGREPRDLILEHNSGNNTMSHFDEVIAKILLTNY